MSEHHIYEQIQTLWETARAAPAYDAGEWERLLAVVRTTEDTHTDRTPIREILLLNAEDLLRRQSTPPPPAPSTFPPDAPKEDE
jgi:hypothetical protein